MTNNFRCHNLLPISPASPKHPVKPYLERQADHDAEYLKAWESAPKKFKKAVSTLGLDAEPEQRDGMGLEFDDNAGYSDPSEYNPDVADLISNAYTPDMAGLIDDYVDEVIEKYGTKYAPMIRAIAVDLKKPMELELIKNRALLLGRVCCYLVSDEKGNAPARIHALLHSIPRLAAINGFPSLRASAKKCRVSPEWLRKTRDKCCEDLGLEVPAKGTKSVEAKAKYKSNAMDNHWRNQKYRAPVPPKS